MRLDLLIAESDNIYQQFILELRKLKHVFIPCARDGATPGA